MKALTLLQPWATLIAEGKKPEETRSWYPRRGELQPGELLAITASAKMGPADKEYAAHWGYRLADLPLGCVVAVVAYKGWLPTTQVPPNEYGDFTPGRYAWLLSLRLKLPWPLPVRGALGVWQLPTDVERQVREQVQGIIPPPATAPDSVQGTLLQEAT